MTSSLGRVSEFPVEEASRVQVNGTSYVVVRRADDEVCVVLDKCPHAGLSLTKGPRGGYDDGVITCPWHNSRFDVCTGANLDWTPGVAGVKVPAWSRKVLALGKQPAPLTVVPVHVADGEILLDT